MEFIIPYHTLFTLRIGRRGILYAYEYTVVLAYMPSETTDKKYGNISLYPDGMEYVPKRFAVSHRNDWMIKHSNFVICCIRHHFGGAYQFVEKSKSKNLIIINLFSE